MKTLFVIMIIFGIAQFLQAQSVGIGTASPNPSAALDVTSVTQGMLVPRMTSAQRSMISSPAQGLLVFDLTTNSFWFRNASSWVQLVDSVSTEVHRSGPSTIYTGMTDYVGVGTSTPAHKLEVKTLNEDYGISHTNGTVDVSTYVSNLNGGYIGTKSNHPFQLYANDGFNQFTLTPSGNVGIGTSSPVQKLHVAGNLVVDNNVGIGNFDPHAQLQLNNSIVNRKIVLFESFNNDHQFYGFGINGSTLRYQVDDPLSNHVFYAATSNTNSKELMRIQGNGYVGIGLAPSNQLDIELGTGRTGSHVIGRPLYVTGNIGAASNGIEFRHENGTQGIGFGFNTIYATGSNESQDLGLAAKGSAGNLKFSTNEIEKMRLTSLGDVGIGTSTPAQKLHVEGGAYFANNVGIGTATPHANLQLNNDVVNRKIVLYEGANNDHQFYGFGINGSTLRYQVSNTVDNHIFYAGASVSSSNELMRIQGNGNVGIGTTTPGYKLSVTNKFGIDANGSAHFPNVPRQIYFYDDALPSKMILSHSPSYPTWGLQYTAANQFRFLKDSAAVMTVDLQNNKVEINGALKIGYVLTSTVNVSIPALSWGGITCNCPAGTVVLSGGFNWNVNIGYMNKSYADSSSSWYASAYNADLTSHTLYVNAICARLAN